MRWVASLIAIAVIATGTIAGAAPKRVAIVGVEIGGDGAPELQTQLAASIASGITAGNAKSIVLSDVREALRDSPELLGCISSTCLARLGEKLGADGFLRGKVEAEGADYTVELELYNTSELIHRISKACTVCTISELNTLIESSTKVLLEGATDSPVQVVIRTEPSGAELTIDGQGQGLSPFEGPLSPGPHLVVARASSGKLARERIEVTPDSAGEPIVIRIEEPVIVTPPPPPPSDRQFGSLKWAAAGGAVGALVLGTTLIVLDGRGTCGESDRQCPRVYNTQTAGIASIGLGLAAGALAAYMFWSDSKKPSEPTVAPSINVDGSGAQVGLRARF